MVNGLEKFREYFSEFDGMYMLIGGVACGLLMDEAGLDFRSTKDFDIVLIVEALNEDFAKVFWQFIKVGEYEIRECSNGKPEFYRFKNPKDISYPKQIELFSRKSDVLKYNDVDRLIPIHISDEVSSLSAILLNEEYYQLLTSGLIRIDEIQILNYTHIIPFKAKAWIDLKTRKENGENIDSSDIKKHKYDVFRLSQLIVETDRIELTEKIKTDMTLFISQMESEDIALKDIGVSGSKDDILKLLKQIYMIEDNDESEA